MNFPTDNLLNLIQKYQKTDSDSFEVLVDPDKELQIKNNRNEENRSNQKDVFFEYSPIKVEYFKYNDYIYRREVDSQNNISWEIVKQNMTFKIVHPIQIRNLEEKIKNI